MSEISDKKKRRIIIAIILSLVAIIDVSLAIIFIPRFFKKKASEDNKYLVSETTINRYNNILKYINKETDGVYEPSTSIVSYTLENKVIKLSTVLPNEKSLYVELTTTYESYDESLKIFDNDLSVGSYTINVKYEDISSHNLNLQVDKYVCINTNSFTETYISATYQKDKSIYSYTHEHQLLDGYHKKTSLEEDKELYDFYYYLVNRE